MNHRNSAKLSVVASTVLILLIGGLLIFLVFVNPVLALFVFILLLVSVLLLVAFSSNGYLINPEELIIEKKEDSSLLFTYQGYSFLIKTPCQISSLPEKDSNGKVVPDNLRRQLTDYLKQERLTTFDAGTCELVSLQDARKYIPSLKPCEDEKIKSYNPGDDHLVCGEVQIQDRKDHRGYKFHFYFVRIWDGNKYIVNKWIMVDKSLYFSKSVLLSYSENPNSDYVEILPKKEEEII